MNDLWNSTKSKSAVLLKKVELRSTRSSKNVGTQDFIYKYVLPDMDYFPVNKDTKKKDKISQIVNFEDVQRPKD